MLAADLKWMGFFVILVYPCLFRSSLFLWEDGSTSYATNTVVLKRFSSCRAGSGICTEKGYQKYFV